MTGKDDSDKYDGQILKRAQSCMASYFISCGCLDETEIVEETDATDDIAVQTAV